MLTTSCGRELLLQLANRRRSRFGQPEQLGPGHDARLLLVQRPIRCRDQETSRRSHCLARAIPLFSRSTQIAEDLQIVAVLVAMGQREGFGVRLLQRVFELAASVSGIDSDEHHAEPRGRELQQHPFGAVARPDGQVIALANPEPHEAEATRPTSAQTVPSSLAIRGRQKRWHPDPGQRLAVRATPVRWSFLQPRVAANSSCIDPPRVTARAPHRPPVNTLSRQFPRQNGCARLSALSHPFYSRPIAVTRPKGRSALV